MSPIWLKLAPVLFCATTVSCQIPGGCKKIPGDSEWPSTSEWDAFNATVGGRLVRTVPLGASCHGSEFDNSTCEDIKSRWQYEEIQYVRRRRKSD
jgi:hypothetical protein